MTRIGPLNLLEKCRAWLRGAVTREALELDDPRVEAVRRKAPHARGAVIFLHKGLGDLVLALPALRALSALGPIALFVEDDRFNSLLEEHGITSDHIYPRKSLRAWLAAALRSFDYCVNFDSLHICFPSRVLMMVAHAKVNVGYDSGPLQCLVQLVPRKPSTGRFMGHVFDDLAKCLGGVPMPVPANARVMNHGPVLLHIGGRLDPTNFDKRWPVHKYLELAERCVRLGIPVKILWGPGDPKPEAGSFAPVEYCASTESLFKAIGQARLFVCNNTGVLWVACLHGIETLSFAAPFFLPRWDPREYRRGNNHVLLGDRGCDCANYRCKRGNCIHGIEVETVLEAVTAILEAGTVSRIHIDSPVA